MLSKRQRLTTAEVKEVLARGRSVGRGKALSLKFLDSPAPFKCSAVVSKKLARTAVKRNTLRRAIYRALQESSLPKSGHAILFVQTIPPEKPKGVFLADIIKLLHV